MKVDMCFHASPCHTTKIESNIECIRTHGFAENIYRPLNLVNQIEQIFIVKIIQSRGVLPGSYQEMTIVVRKMVHYNYRMLATIEKESLLITFAVIIGTKYATLWPISQNVVHSPRRP
jgi:hypothetical protein